MYLHQGGRFQAIGGTYHFRNRDLSVTLGRWLQVDPSMYHAGDLLLYRYNEDNPLKFADPFGLQPKITRIKTYESEAGLPTNVKTVLKSLTTPADMIPPYPKDYYNNLGPFVDLNQRLWAYRFLVVAEGTDLSKVLVIRTLNFTSKFGKLTFHAGKGGKEFPFIPGGAATAMSVYDGPSTSGSKVCLDMLIVVFDGVGYYDKKKELTKDHFPATNDINYLMEFHSATARVLAKATYDFHWEIASLTDTKPKFRLSNFKYSTFADV